MGSRPETSRLWSAPIWALFSTIKFCLPGDGRRSERPDSPDSRTGTHPPYLPPLAHFPPPIAFVLDGILDFVNAA